MESELRRAFRLVRKRCVPFEEAVQILLGDHSDDALERRRATRQIVELMKRQLNGFSTQESPRAADATRTLIRTENASRVLRHQLQNLEDLLATYVSLLLPNPLMDPEFWKVFRKSELLAMSTNPEIDQSVLCQRLLDLEEGCRALAKCLPVDRGGNTNILTGQIANPKAQLSYDAGLLFSEFRPGTISSNPEGPFYRFFGVLYEILTGQEPESPGAGLKRYTEFVAPRMRELEKIDAPYMELTFKRIRARLSAEDEWKLFELQRAKQALHEELQMGPPSGRGAP